MTTSEGEVVSSDPAPPPPEEPGASMTAFGYRLLALVLFGYLGLGVPAQIVHVPWGLCITQILVFLGLPAIVLQLSHRSSLRWTGLDQPRFGSVISGVAFGLANSFAWAMPIMALSTAIFPDRIVHLFDMGDLFKHRSTGDLVLIFLGICVLAPLCEEFFFRGVLQRALAQRYGFPKAIVITAAIFSVFHLDPVGALARFELGLIFGLMAWKSGSVWPSMAAHMAHNSIAGIALLSSGFEEVKEEDPTALAIVGMFLIGNAVLLPLLRAFQNNPQWYVARAPAEEVMQPPKSFVRIISPWVVGSLASLAVLVAVDLNGIVLNAFDLVHPLPAISSDAGVAEQAAFDDVWKLREEARAGTASMDDYFSARKFASSSK